MRKLIFLMLLVFSASIFAASGVNIGEGSFGSVRGKMGKDYKYALNSDIDAVKSAGFNMVRIPVRWERLQPTLNGSLNEVDMAHVDRQVNYAISKGILPIIDLHNYAGYNKLESGVATTYKVGTVQVPEAALIDFWLRICARYGTKRVAYGIMNEPSGINVITWATIQQNVVTAIRNAGYKQTLFIQGNLWSGAHSFFKVQISGNANSTNAYQVGNTTDKLKQTAIEVHQYLDKDSSGTKTGCVSATIGVDRIKAITVWAKANGKKLFLGEFAGGKNATCYAALTNMLAYIKQNKDVWIGWTYWADIQWFGTAYEFNVWPLNGTAPQEVILRKFKY